VASNRDFCTNREWCPECLVVSDTLGRAGRTETLTGQAAHTSRAKGQQGEGPDKGRRAKGRERLQAKGPKGQKAKRRTTSHESIEPEQQRREPARCGVAIVQAQSCRSLLDAPRATVCCCRALARGGSASGILNRCFDLPVTLLNREMVGKGGRLFTTRGETDLGVRVAPH
jgi:hypothetical protein